MLDIIPIGFSIAILSQLAFTKCIKNLIANSCSTFFFALYSSVPQKANADQNYKV